MAQKFTVPVTIKNLSSAGSDAITVFLDQENYARVKLEAGGRITWGDGTGSGDTNLYRTSANTLRTDDAFQAFAGVITLATSGSPTVSLADGALAVDTTNNTFYFRSGGAWNQVTGGGGGATVTVSDTEPASPSEGDLWFESDTASLFIYFDSFWIEIGGSGGGDIGQYFDAKGDLLVGVSDGVLDNLPVGADGTFLRANSSASIGLEWANVPTINALDDIGDVSASAAASGDFLKWNGSSWVNDQINLGTDTAGNYVSDVTAGTGVSITHTPGEGSSAQVAIGQDVDISASVTFAHVSADVTGDLTGRADTASALHNARTISISGDVSGSVSFDGSQNVSISATIEPNSVALGTDTTGNYLVDVAPGTGVIVTHTPGEGSSASIAIGQDVGTSASVTFGHVTAPVTGNVVGNVTGNASTATALQTAREIQLSGDVSGSASFDGTSNINIFTTVNTASVAIGELNGVNITNPEEFQTLEYNGTEWVNAYSSVVSYVRNAEATTLTTGTAVYLFGATGDHATVKRADNTTDTTSSKTVGLVGAPIAASQNGPIITRGYVDGIDLSVGYNPGDILWLGKNGQFTTTKPSAPDHMVFIGVVARATNNGIVYVATQNGYEIDELHNVKINGVTDGQFLRYNSGSAIWVNDTINLGTDTAGDYVQSLVAGTGVTLSNNSGESATPTVAIGQDVATSASVTFAHLIVQGNMEVQGTITRLNETNLDVDTAFIYLNANSASANPDMGVAFNYNDGTYKHAGFFRDSSDGIFKVFEGYTPEPVSPIDTSDPTYEEAPLQAERFISTVPIGVPPLSVSSSTVVTNLNADKLDGQDGSYYAPINSPTFTGTVTLPNNTVALGTQTTGNYVADVSAGTGVTVTHTPGEGTTPSVAIGQDVATSASVTFAHVSAPITGNVSGNASTATTLQNARTISLGGDLSGSASFNGSSDVTITATVQPDSVALGTDTTGNYVQSLVAGTGITLTNATASEGGTPTIAVTANTYQPLDADLTAIAGLAGTSGLLKKTAADNWTLDTATYVSTADTGTVTSAMIANGTIVDADINTSAAIAHSKLANATAGQVLLGTTTTGVVTATTLSGDVTIDGGGVTAIASGAIVNADINASAAIDKTKISGTAITAADTGTVTSTMIADGTIVNADINTSAAIALTKLASDTTTALGVGTVELGHATDTTLARGSAGRLTVEGVNVVTISSSDTLTNKTISSGTLTGSLTAGGGTGTSGQFLKSTGTGVTWADATSSGGSDPVFQSMMYR